MARRTLAERTTSIFWMIGECSGKMRSTPWPNDTLRTVNDRARAAAAQADDDALEDLDAFLVAFLDPDVHLDRVAGLHRAAASISLRLLDHFHRVHAAPFALLPVPPTSARRARFTRSGRRARVRAAAPPRGATARISP